MVARAFLSAMGGTCAQPCAVACAGVSVWRWSWARSPGCFPWPRWCPQAGPAWYFFWLPARGAGTVSACAASRCRPRAMPSRCAASILLLRASPLSRLPEGFLRFAVPGGNVMQAPRLSARLLLALCGAVVFVAGCGSATAELVKFNDLLVKHFKALDKAYQDFDSGAVGVAAQGEPDSKKFNSGYDGLKAAV